MEQHAVDVVLTHLRGISLLPEVGPLDLTRSREVRFCHAYTRYILEVPDLPSFEGISTLRAFLAFGLGHVHKSLQSPLEPYDGVHYGHPMAPVVHALKAAHGHDLQAVTTSLCSLIEAASRSTTALSYVSWTPSGAVIRNLLRNDSRMTEYNPVPPSPAVLTDAWDRGGYPECWSTWQTLLDIQRTRVRERAMESAAYLSWFENNKPSGGGTSIRRLGSLCEEIAYCHRTGKDMDLTYLIERWDGGYEGELFGEVALTDVVPIVLEWDVGRQVEIFRLLALIYSDAHDCLWSDLQGTSYLAPHSAEEGWGEGVYRRCSTAVGERRWTRDCISCKLGPADLGFKELCLYRLWPSYCIEDFVKMTSVPRDSHVWPSLPVIFQDSESEDDSYGDLQDSDDPDFPDWLADDGNGWGEDLW